MSEFSQNPSLIIHTTTTTKKPRKPTTTKRSQPSSKSKTTLTNTTNKPLKVVYISNPMRVEARAAEFRALVQELTGRDASEWHDDTSASPYKRVNINDQQIPAARNSAEKLVLPAEFNEVPLLADEPISCFGSDDLEYFWPFDGDCDGDHHDDQMVVMEELTSLYQYNSCLQ